LPAVDAAAVDDVDADEEEEVTPAATVAAAPDLVSINS
jgi:hypothetical protein